MTTKQKVIQALAIILPLAVVGIVVSDSYMRHHPTVDLICVAGNDESCPSDQFVSDFQHWKSLRADLAKRTQSGEVKQYLDEIDLVSGLTQRLNAQIPTGYTWNEQKSKFTKVQQMQTIIPPPPEKKK